MEFGSLRLKIDEPYAVSIDLISNLLKIFNTLRDKQKVQQFQNMNNDKNNYA